MAEKFFIKKKKNLKAYKRFVLWQKLRDGMT